MADSIPSDRRGETFYGWYIVAATSFMTFVVIGSRQTFGLFVDSWTKEFGVSVVAISVVSAIGWVVNGLSNPVMGKLADRFGGRIVIVLSMLVLGVGTVLMGLVPNILLLAFLYGLVLSFAMGGVMFTPATSVVSRWFRRRRGTAMGILAAGGSLGGMVLVPFTAYLLLFSDWRTAWVVLGGIMLVIALPLLLLIVRSDPREMHLEPDGDERLLLGGGGAVSAKARTGPLTAERWPTCFRSMPMWQLMLGYVVCGVTTGSINVHFVPFATAQGISAQTAALAFGLLSLMNLLGVLGFGFLSDRTPRKNLLALIYLIRAIAFLLLVVLPASTGLWLFAGVAGVSWLATVPLTSSLAADIYGVRNIGTVAGIMTMAHQFGAAGAIVFAGWSFTMWGSYTPSFIVSFALLVAAGVLSWTVRERTYSARYQMRAIPTPESA